MLGAVVACSAAGVLTLIVAGVLTLGVGGLSNSFVDWLNGWPDDQTTKWTMEDLPELLPGDIVLERHSFIASHMIQIGLNTYWNHATVIVNSSYDIVENTGAGVVFENLKNDMNLDIAIYRNPDLSDEERERIAQEAVSLVGKENDWLIVPRSVREVGWRTPVVIAKALWALWTGDGDVPLPHIEDDYLVCYEVVQEAYSNAGIPLVDDGYLLLPRNVVVPGRDGKLERLFGPDKL